ncbi:5596_t:CDS:2, partial [Scutellospora calospora]
MRSHRQAFTPVRPFLLWTLVLLSLLFIFAYAKSKLDSKELVRFNPPHFSRLVSVVNALPPKLDLSPINLVLISTLDGNLHGVDRYTGHVLWSLEGATEGFLIKTFTRPATKQPNATNNDDREEFDYSDIILSKDQDDINHHTIDDSQLTKLNGDPEEEEDPDLEITYIVEPNNDGILYMFSPKTGLQKFPQTVKQLVMNSPFRSVDGKVFIVGSKSTKFFAIDPATGKILQSFNSDNELENECPSTGSLPRDALYVGMNAYKISIFNERGKPKWNLTYTEYVPHSFDANIELMYNTSPDGYYISSTHNGEVLSTDSTNGEHNWYQQFSSPAVGIFDVLASKELSSGLHVVRQPRPSVAYYSHLPKQKPSQLSAYVGNIDGTLFVMSVENYPLTQSMPFGIPGKTDEEENKFIKHEGRCHPGSSIYPECLVGNHMMSTIEQSVPVIDPPLKDKDNTTRIPKISSKPQIAAQVGISWAIIILVIVGFFYLGGRRGNGLRPSLENKRRFGSLFENKFMNFFKQSPQRDFPVTKPGGKKDSPKKNKKRGKSTAVAKKLDIKDDEKLNKSSSTKISTTKEITDDIKVLPIENPILNNYSTTVTATMTTEITSSVSTTVNGELKLNSLVVTDTILGYGSHGTIVYKGSFEGRDVAVKRLLLDFYDIAYHEVSLLQESDDHPNVIRYYCKEQSDRFLYIALELCPASLHDLIERGSTFQHSHLLASIHPPSKILYQIIAGLHHLHSMKIVHRDIKPQNILIAPSKNKKISKDGVTQIPSLRVLISDFGLCKKLDGETSSFHNTTNNAGGTIGWRAPELLSPPSPDGINIGTEEVWTSVDLTKSIDIFSAGCLFYYVLSNGDHPFGDRYSREINILKG